MAKEKDRIFYIALLSVISAIAVVFCHANEFYLFDHNPNWAIRNMIEGITHFAVPVFFMITGAMLLDYTKRYSLSEYFKKRINKTLVPFLFWSLIGLGWSIFLKKTSPDSLSFMFIINGVFYTSFVPIYWFFIDLFRIYLWIPLLACIKEENKCFVFTYFILCLFIIDSFIPFVLDKYGITPYFDMKLSQNYLIYVLMGYVLSKYEIELKWRRSIYMLAILSVLAITIGTYVLSIGNDAIEYTYIGYKNVPCVLYSAGVFLFAKNLTKKINFNEKFKATVYFLSKYTLAIYLLHIFIIDTVKLYLPYSLKTSIPCIFALSLAVIPACILLTIIIRRIPFGKFVLPE